MEGLAIRVQDVSKDFKLPHQKVTTLKGAFLNILNRGKRIEAQHALRSISFDVKRGEFFGIVGRNGSGKSTLLKMLAGIYQPNQGVVHTNGKLVPFIELGVGFNPELSGHDNVYLNGALLGFSKAQVDAMYDKIVGFAELEEFMDQKLKNYSSGMQVRLAFSVAINAEADILLVDEVLAVGDADFQRKCFEYFRQLKKAKKTVVFVTHDMGTVREYCDRAILIDDSRLVAEGSADEIASRYTRLFSSNAIAEGVTGEGGKRWGDGLVKYDSIQVKQTGEEGSARIEIITTATAQAGIEDPVFGFVIKNSAGQPILGTNTRIRKVRVGDIAKNQKVTVKWAVPNIFSDGEHYVEPAIVHNDAIQVCDWWEEAARFNVVKEDRTPYVVTPYVTVEVA